MYHVKIGDREYFVQEEMLLSEFLLKEGFDISHPCGGFGKCKKCTVTVNGKKELSCRYRIQSDITVEFEHICEIKSETGVAENGKKSENICLVLDIGTTTMALASVNLDDGSVADVKKCTNPQRRYGADVISRIDYCSKNGVSELHCALVSAINKLISEINPTKIRAIYASGNSVMLHTLLNENPSSMGTYPYTPIFSEAMEVDSASLGIDIDCKIITLPSVSAFVGADIVAGLNCVKKPKQGKYGILIDLGTNAEIVLFDDRQALCTSAAAGPCFEGADISSGMSALPGAVYAYGENGARTIGDAEAVGICGTGLVDVVAYILRKGIMDETGFMDCGEFIISGDVTITQKDIRQYQLAKSAICSAIMTLMKNKAVEADDIESVYISGGFSAEINVENAIATGLIPKGFAQKCVPVYNSSLLGTIKFALEQNDLQAVVDGATYVDLSADEFFSELFVKNMLF